jgi:hypothetical protein
MREIEGVAGGNYVASSLCALLLIAATARAQEQFPVPAPDPASVASRPAIRVEVYRYYSALRRGTAENVAIVLLANSPEGVPTGSGIEITSLTLELPAADGLALSKFQSQDTQKEIPIPRHADCGYDNAARFTNTLQAARRRHNRDRNSLSQWQAEISNC